MTRKQSPISTTPLSFGPFISRQQAAQLLSVSLSTIDKLVETGQLPAFRVLRAVRLRLSDVMNVAVPR
jgi:excisionase family DNA binding protein